MKKKNVINLIKYYSEKNDIGFRNEAYQIARFFDSTGDSQLSEYIMSLLSDANTFVPQINGESFNYFEKLEIQSGLLALPEIIESDILSIVGAVNRGLDINKFIFHGKPGTGKTEAVKQIARILSRELFSIDFNTIMDSKLGQTQKNLSAMFRELDSISYPEKVIVLFDEIDIIALDRTNNSDVREMGRVTSTMLKELDKLSDKIVIVATTNLFVNFDKALLRRFDMSVDFDRYTRDDVLKIAELMLNESLQKYKVDGRNIRLFKKILGMVDELPQPAELCNLIKTAIVFSEPSREFDYLKKLYEKATNNREHDLKHLKKLGFTVREIEIITGVPKSNVSREVSDSE